MKKSNNIFHDNREFKVLFWCRQCKFSMYESVAKLLWQSYHVAKLLATEKTGPNIQLASSNNTLSVLLPSHLKCGKVQSRTIQVTGSF